MLVTFSYACSKSGLPKHVLRIPAYRQHALVLSVACDEPNGTVVLCASGSQVYAFGPDLRPLTLTREKVSMKHAFWKTQVGCPIQVDLLLYQTLSGKHQQDMLQYQCFRA